MRGAHFKILNQPWFAVRIEFAAGVRIQQDVAFAHRLQAAQYQKRFPQPATVAAPLVGLDKRAVFLPEVREIAPQAPVGVAGDCVEQAERPRVAANPPDCAAVLAGAAAE